MGIISCSLMKASCHELIYCLDHIVYKLVFEIMSASLDKAQALAKHQSLELQRLFTLWQTGYVNVGCTHGHFVALKKVNNTLDELIQ